MSIVKNLEIKINNDEARLSENVYVYQNDRGVQLKLKLNLVRTNYRSAVKSSFFESNDILASATILKPNGSVIGKSKSVVINDTITFTIDREFTDQVDEIGVYKVQFHLYDSENNRITIPPVEFEVKELLGFIDESELEHNFGVVDKSLSDSCLVADGDNELIIFADGRYIKTVWNSGDLVSSSKLNKIEEAIYNLDGRFSIGEEPISEDTRVWIDVPNMDSSNYNINDTNSHSSYNVLLNKEAAYSGENTLLDILNSLSDKVDRLEKEINLLKK